MEENQPLWKGPIENDLIAVDTIIDGCISEKNDTIGSAMRYAMTPRGKMIRPTVCLLSYYSCGGKTPEAIQRFAAASELLHTATLIHDDINDKSDYRRGKKTLYRKYGARKALAVGDTFLISGFNIVKDNLSRYLNSISNIAYNLTNSEFDQIRNEYNVDITEEQYISIITGKTASFFAQCCKMGAMCADASEEQTWALERYGLMYGLSFQISDDIIDICGNTKDSGKSVGIDIESGKMTLPTIIAMNDPHYGKQIKEEIRRHKTAKTILPLIRETDSVQQCQRMVDYFSNEALKSLELLDETVYKNALADLIAASLRRTA